MRIFFIIVLMVAVIGAGIYLYDIFLVEPEINDNLPYYKHIPNKRALELNNKAMQLFYTGNFKKATALLDESTDIDPLYTTAFHNKCLIYTRDRNFPGALKSIKAAILLNPREPAYYVLASAISKVMGKDGESRKYHEKTINACNLMLKDKTNGNRTRQGIYFLLASIGEKEMAIEGLKKMLVDDPGNEMTGMLLEQVKTGQIKKMEIPVDEPCGTIDEGYKH